MPSFTSGRERRLWFWTLTVVVTIYATLGLAGTLAEALRDSDLLRWFVGACFAVVLVAIVGSALRREAARREIWVALGVSAVLVMVVARMGVGAAERTHLFEYGLLAVLVHQALAERARPLRLARRGDPGAPPEPRLRPARRGHERARGEPWPPRGR